MCLTSDRILCGGQYSLYCGFSNQLGYSVGLKVLDFDECLSLLVALRLRRHEDLKEDADLTNEE